MAKRANAHGGVAALRWLLMCTLGLVVTLVGCGGNVVVSEESVDTDADADADDPSQDAGSSGGTTGSASQSLSDGNCVACDGQPECAFCLVHALDTTYLCPPNKSSPQTGCMSLGEEHTSKSGVSFTCYYCN